MGTHPYHAADACDFNESPWVESIPYAEAGLPDLSI